MEKDATYTVNRQELIRMARESCEGNLKASGNGRFTYGFSKKEDKSTKKMNGKVGSKGATTGVAAVKRRDSIAESSLSLSKRQMSIKLLLIRTICASVIVLAVILIDKLKISYETFDSNYIANNIESNRVYDKAEELFTTLQQGKIVDVFNGLD